MKYLDKMLRPIANESAPVLDLFEEDPTPDWFGTETAQGI